MNWKILSSRSLQVVAATVVGCSIYTLLAPSIILQERYVITKGIFLRVLSIVTACALYSLQIQCEGLFGDNGLYPLENSLKVIQKFLAEKSPTDILSPEYALHYILSLVLEKFHTKGKYSRKLLSCLQFDLAAAIVGFVWPHPVIFVYLYISYYAYKRISGPFLNFQWDALLLECLFVSIPLSLSNSSWMDSICIWLCRFLLFRLMFGSGVVKAYGRDPSWFRDYTAMSYHFLTQPLPNGFGRWVSLYCPSSWLSAMTVGTLTAEIALPLLSLLCFPSVNALVAVGYSGLMISIALTGYYGFFNILTIAISSVLVSDAVFVSCLQYVLSPSIVKELLSFCFPQSYLSTRRGQTYDPFDGHSTVWGAFGQLFCIFVNTPLVLVLSLTFVMSILRLCERCHLIRPQETRVNNENDSAIASSDDVSPSWFIYHKLCVFQDYMVKVFYVGNHYGLFANMTKQRDEIVIEVAVNPTPWKASHDPRKLNSAPPSDRKSDSDVSTLVWHPIVFNYKPDDVNTAPKAIRPFFHMPRFDWCLWFLSLKPGVKFYPTWFWHFLLCLIECDKDVVSLLHPTTAVLLASLRQEVRDQQELRQKQLSMVSSKTASHSSKEEVDTSDTTDDMLVDGLLLRVSLWRYTYTKDSGKPADDNIDASSPTPEERTGHYWHAVKRSELVEPINRNHLQYIYEQAVSSSSSATKGKTASPKPTVETAQEIIMRTLFNKLKARREEKKASSQVEHMDMDSVEESSESAATTKKCK